MELYIWTDGGSRGNPGEGAVGVIAKIKDQKSKIKNNEEIIFSFGKRIGRVTNNEAEYMAVIEALKAVSSVKYQVSNIQFFMDSKLICEQLQGNWKIKQDHLRTLFSQVKILELSLGIPVAYNHIRREGNKEADKLVNQALDAG